MHRLKVALMGVALLAVLAIPSIGNAACSPAPCIELGDMDLDGFPTSLDLGAMIDYLFAGGSELVPHVSDMDGDGFGTSLDLGILIDLLFAGRPAIFPARTYTLVGRSGAGTTRLLCGDSIFYSIGDPVNGGTYNVGTDEVDGEPGLVNECPKTDTLLIPAGSNLFGSLSAANPSAFIVRRTGYVVAVGTAAAPIVLSSPKPVGLRARSDWGGMVINGCACDNDSANGYIVEVEGDGGLAGGFDNHDNSGCYKYFRVQFAGREFSLDNELNGITLAAVGDGTTMEYIQVNQNFDDGIEWFGGRCNMKHAVLSGCGDDGFDSDFGAQWKGQYLIDVRDPNGVNSSNYNGFEWDNEANAPYIDCPRMKPTIWNATMIGAGCESFENRHDANHIRRGADGNINNTVWTEWHAALEYDEPDVWADLACDPDNCHDRIDMVGNPDANIEINNSIWYNVFQISGNATATNEMPYMPASVGGAHPTNVYPAEGCGNPPLLIQEFIDGVTAMDFRPVVGDPQGVGINAPGAVPPVDGFFDPAGAMFKGAVKENDPSPWYEGWTDFATE